MKIVDAVIELMYSEKYISCNLYNGFVPALDPSFCHDVLVYAGKKPSTGFGQKRVLGETSRIRQALESDDRFEKYVHVTGRAGYELRKEFRRDSNIEM